VHVAGGDGDILVDCLLFMHGRPAGRDDRRRSPGGGARDPDPGDGASPLDRLLPWVVPEAMRIECAARPYSIGVVVVVLATAGGGLGLLGLPGRLGVRAVTPGELAQAAPAIRVSRVSGGCR
jgi:hypothetical protein